MSAVTLFGARPFEQVTVGELAAAAEVTTGAIYHHFDSKLGLYDFVRRDVERRLLDRMEGAAEGASSDPLGVALLVGFDYAVRADFTRLLSEPQPGAEVDHLAELIATLAATDGHPLGVMIAAAWRACLTSVARGANAADARAALQSLTVRMPQT
ncbi:MAG: helix-turn-helix domain-containing protein [Ornithinimicrobium sp.]